MSYNIIYADPPWQTAAWGKLADQTRLPPYPTMSDSDLLALSVADLAAADSVLFLWAVDHKLDFAVRLGESWGFRFNTVGFYWLKRRPGGDGWHVGTGYTTRAGAVEQCLLFVRGRGLVRQSKAVRRLFDDVIIEPVRDHSSKPDEIARRIVALYGDVPRVELFARTRRPGWSVWGNETESESAAVDALGQPARPEPVDVVNWWTG